LINKKAVSLHFLQSRTYIFRQHLVKIPLLRTLVWHTISDWVTGFSRIILSSNFCLYTSGLYTHIVNIQNHLKSTVCMEKHKILPCNGLARVENMCNIDQWCVYFWSADNETDYCSFQSYTYIHYFLYSICKGDRTGENFHFQCKACNDIFGSRNLETRKFCCFFKVWREFFGAKKLIY